MQPFELDLPGEKLARELNKSFGMSDSFLGVARLQAEVLRSVKPYQHIFERNRKLTRFAEMSAITGIAQAIRQVNKSVAYDGLIGLNKVITQMRPVFPTNFHDTISTLARQQEALFGKSLQVTPFLDNRSAAQLASMRVAINGMSGYVANLAAQTRQWEIAEAYETVTAEAINLADHLFDDPGETLGDEALWQSFWAAVLVLYHQSQKAGKRAIRIIEIVVAIWGAYQIYVAVTNPAATKADLKVIKKQIIDSIHEQMKAYELPSEVKRRCVVKLKPRSRSTVFCKLPAGYQVVILQVSHQWVLISFSDPADGYPATGWVMKKYLDRSK